MAGCRGDRRALPPQPGVDALAYDLDLAVDPGAQIVAGTTRITVRHTPTTGALALRFGTLDGAPPGVLRALLVDDTPVDGRRDGAYLWVPLPDDTLSVVEVGYVLDGPQDGLYYEEAVAGDGEGQTVVFTDSQFLRGASWLPAVHHPADPATLTLSLSVPDTLDVVASGTPSADTRTPGGLRRLAFEVDAAVPTYTFAFAVGDFTATAVQTVTLPSGVAIPVQHHLLGTDTTDARWLVRTPETLAYFDSTLGPYAFDSYATAQVPIPFAGMENAATAFLRDDLYGQTYRGANVVEQVNVHEVAHMWFGNRVTIRDYRDLWLSEGIVSYLTTLYYEAADGPAAARTLRAQMSDFGTGADLTDARQPLVPDTVETPMDLIGATVYQKGGSVVHLLRLTLGDAAFFGALRRAYTEYGRRQHPLSTAAFQALLEDTAGQDLDAFFAYWVYGSDVPTLRARWDDTTRRLSWTLNGDAGLLAPLDIELEIEQTDATQIVSLAQGSVTLDGTRVPTIRPIGVPLRMR